MSCPEHPAWLHDKEDCPLCAVRRARDKGAPDDGGSWELIKAQVARADADTLRKRLEITTLIYAYVEKEFARRFPAEHQEWAQATDRDD